MIGSRGRRRPTTPKAKHALTTTARREPISASLPIGITTLTMRTILIGTLCTTLAIGFWYALTTSLTDMARRDCSAGIERACLQLQKDGVRL